MSHTKTKQTKKSNAENLAAFEIRGELAAILRGMEGSNWTTSISKNNVKTVSVTFRVKHPTVAVRVNG